MSGLADEELGWFRQLGRALSKGGPTGDEPKTARPLVPRAFIEWPSFDLADLLEQGLAREIATSFVHPPPQEQPARRMVVQRSEDHCEHILTSSGGEQLLFAKGAKGSGHVDIYVPIGGDPPVAVGPAFTLTADDDSKTSWTLTTDRCECCEYTQQTSSFCARKCRREIAHIHQERRRIGHGTMMCMEVDVPAPRQDGTPSVWCPRSTKEEEWSRVSLVTREPKWNNRTKSLTLDFYGRCTRASAKNFQLEHAEQGGGGQGQEPELLFGKVADNEFALDYKHPLGMAQAFAVALSAREWQ